MRVPTLLLKEGCMCKRDLRQVNHSKGMHLLIRNMYSDLATSDNILSHSKSEIESKVTEVIDSILIQARLEDAQKKRDARNAKRLKSMRK